MSERNARRHYHIPTRAEVTEIQKDPRNVKWSTLGRIVCRAVGTELSWLQLHDILDLKRSEHVFIKGQRKPVWGWWRFA